MHIIDRLSSFPFLLSDGTWTSFATEYTKMVDGYPLVVLELEWCLPFELCDCNFECIQRLQLLLPRIPNQVWIGESLNHWSCHFENCSVHYFRNSALLWWIRDRKLMLNSLSFTIIFKCFRSLFTTVSDRILLTVCNSGILFPVVFSIKATYSLNFVFRHKKSLSNRRNEWK